MLTQFGIEDEKDIVIPTLVLRLCVQDLDPRDFVNELSHQLNVDFAKAKEITQVIEEIILRPIETELRRDVGVDIKYLYFGQPGAPLSQSMNAPIASQTKEIKQEPIPIKVTETPSGPNVSAWLKPKIEVSSPTTSPTSPPPPPQPKTPPKPISNGGAKIDLEHFEIKGGEPFILHQELGSTPASETQNISPGLTFKIQTPPSPNGKPMPQKPVSVKLEAPRTVNYSDFRTPLPALPTPPKPQNKNTVDLRNSNK